MPTANTRSRRALISVTRKLLAEAGLTPARVRAAIAVANGRSRASATAVVVRPASLEHLRYAAAWLGLTTGEPAVTAFHSHDDGPHTLHIIHAPVRANILADKLTAAGLSHFAIEPAGEASRAYVVHTGDLAPVARSLNARHTIVNGTAERIGADPGAGPEASRSAYREAIRAAEAAE